MNRSARHVVLAMLGALLIAVAGCDSRGLGYVEGQIRLDGEPLAEAMVEFQSNEGHVAYGRTDDKGRYVMKATASQTGIPAGNYTVRISTDWIVSNPDGSRTQIPERLPPRYHEQSELEREVKPGPQTVHFELTAK